jgi:hypothetical protein
MNMVVCDCEKLDINNGPPRGLWNTASSDSDDPHFQAIRRSVLTAAHLAFLEGLITNRPTLELRMSPSAAAAFQNSGEGSAEPGQRLWCHESGAYLLPKSFCDMFVFLDGTVPEGEAEIRLPSQGTINVMTGRPDEGKTVARIVNCVRKSEA